MKANGLALDFLPSNEELAALERRCFSRPWCATAYRDLRGNPHVKAWVLREDEAAVGFVCFQLVEEEAELLRIGVLPDKRGEGRGRLLLEEFLSHCAEQSAGRVFLEVRSENRAATRLYESSGFRRLGVRKGYFQDPVEDALIYRFTGASPPRPN